MFGAYFARLAYEPIAHSEQRSEVIFFASPTVSFPSWFESPEFKSTAYRLASGMPFSSLVITLSSSDTVSSGLVSSGVVPSSLVTSEEDSVSSSPASSEEASVCSSL